MGDDDGLIGIVGDREVYLVRRPAFSDNKERVLYLRRKRPDVEGPIFLLYGDIRPAEERPIGGFQETRSL